MEQELVLVLDDQTHSAKRLVWWLYLLHGLCLVLSLGLLLWVPLIVNYLKRGETVDTFLYSHHQWQIRSFWWYLLWVIVGGIIWLTLFGMPLAVLIWTLAWIWKAYRIIRGWLQLSDNQPMPE